MHHFLTPPPGAPGKNRSPYSIPVDAGITTDLVNWMFEAQSSDVIDLVLEKKTVEFSITQSVLPLEYYCLGYCIAHSQCQWVLSMSQGWGWHMVGIGEEEVRMLVAGVNIMEQPSGRVVGLRLWEQQHSDRVVGLRVGEHQPSVRAAWLRGRKHAVSVEVLNILFRGWKHVLHLHELGLRLPVACDSITWPDLSALRVLSLDISGKTNWSLDTLLPHLSLESLTLSHNESGDNVGLVPDDCVAIGDHVLSTTCLKECCFLYDGEIFVGINDKGLEAITKALADNKSLLLERLNLDCECTFTDTAADCLSQFISNTTTLKYLRMCQCTLSAHGLLKVARAIHDNSTLQEKSLEYLTCEVNGDDEAKELAQLLVDYPQFEGRYRFTTIRSHINDAGAVALADILHRNFTLENLNLSNNSISDAGAAAIAQTLHHNSTLKELDLPNNSISYAGAIALAQALHHNSTLKKLDLSNNSSSDGGAVALAQALHHNSTLNELDLPNNSISYAGAVALAQAIHRNCTLKKLDLSNNSITDAGAVALAQAIHRNCTLKKLDLSNNSITDAGAVTLAQTLHQNSTLKELDLSHNSICDTGAVALAQALHYNCTLEWLHLSNNSINDAGAVALAQALHHNSTLQWLDYGNDDIGGQESPQVVQAVAGNISLLTATSSGVSNTQGHTYNQSESGYIGSGSQITPKCVELIATLPECTSMLVKYLDKSNGFSLEIPKGAIPEGERITIDIGVALYGPFQYPEGFRPVSPVFWLCVRDRKCFCFLKPVTVTISHFLHLESHDDIESLGLTFLKGDHEMNSQQMYQFQRAEGDVCLEPLKEHGVLQTTHFCLLCISSKISEKLIQKASFCLYSAIPPVISPMVPANVYFFVTFLLQTCINSVKKQISATPSLCNHILKWNRFRFSMDSHSHDPALGIILPPSDPPEWIVGLQFNKEVCLVMSISIIAALIMDIH